jgi:hypothetical protein
VCSSDLVFVFGANPEWRHGAGAAKVALNFGAQYGKGPSCGQTYGLITKNLTPGFIDQDGKIYHAAGLCSVSKNDICENIKKLYEYASNNLNQWFLIAYQLNHQNLNGYTGEEMKEMFYSANPPKNIVFHDSFKL